MDKNKSRTDNSILRDYEAAMRNAAGEFIGAYDRYEKVADDEPVENNNLFGAA